MDVRGSLIALRWYVAPALTGDEREDLEIVGTEVLADFPDSYSLEEDFVVVHDTSMPLQTAGIWVLLQRGFRTTEPTTTQ